ncbi:nucleotidyl transferase, PF08843 family [Prevotella sp. BV3P1]|uniref:nucleotidyl transferase AbiEii/AbiGii toxin family protein n=1 Tax=Prevotellaceae TaxID=171552 RepID=UPI0003B91E76|nr:MULTISPECIES: nucleotidyl transferase AbiEii/AbiGii toxin family protein [Prevotellaceae]ERT61140.1 nucleotidyl transferase, PF08843 family [Prevotella sp. BV3P1]KGF42871.1 nucleotidyltransferase [Hoylesella buccalis DNF00985]
MSSWQNHSSDERIAMIQAVAQDHNIEDNAVEKDWWVTVVLKALFNTSCGKWLLFKGGTSLSKGWNLINRFSEDIDISIGRNFFGDVLNLPFAKCENNNQVKKLRKASRDYIHGTLSAELDAELLKMGVKGYTIMNETVTGEPPRPIDHDSDPTIIFVNYESILPSSMRLIDARVKIEISCLSMSEPYEQCEIRSLVFDKFPEEDDEIAASINTVTPSRTFLEKALLLSEELQKEEPRSLRMSRHLYDLDRLMDTEFGQKALNDGKLYKAIVEHRRRFYHLGYVDYDKDYPAKIDFIPQNKVMNAYRLDYESNMVDGYIYGEAKSFDELMKRMEKLLQDFRQIVIS